MAARTPTFAISTLGSSDITLTTPSDVANGDVLLWIVFGMYNDLLDDGPVTESFGDTDFDDFHPLLSGGMNYHIFARTWLTGDPTSELFTTPNVMTGTQFFGSCVGWSAVTTPKDAGLAWGTVSAFPEHFTGAAETSLGYIHGVGSVWGMPGTWIDNAGQNMTQHTFNDDNGNFDRLAVIVTNGTVNNTYDHELDTWAGANPPHTDRYWPIQLAAQPPARTAAATITTDGPKSYEFRSRRVTAKQMPYEITADMLYRDIKGHNSG